MSWTSFTAARRLNGIVCILRNRFFGVKPLRALGFSRILRSMLTFRTAGESHGQALIALVEGLPASLPIDFDFIDNELKRRQGGYGRGGRMKIERDQVRFLSGVRHGKTIGSPIAMMIENRDWPNWEDIMAAREATGDAAAKRRVTRPRP